MSPPSNGSHQLVNKSQLFRLTIVWSALDARARRKVLLGFKDAEQLEVVVFGLWNASRAARRSTRSPHPHLSIEIVSVEDVDVAARNLAERLFSAHLSTVKHIALVGGPKFSESELSEVQLAFPAHSSYATHAAACVRWLQHYHGVKNAVEATSPSPLPSDGRHFDATDAIVRKLSLDDCVRLLRLQWNGDGGSTRRMVDVFSLAKNWSRIQQHLFNDFRQTLKIELDPLPQFVRDVLGTPH